MRALIVVESHFGNTRKVAEAVAEGLAGVIAVVEDVVDAAAPTPVIDLLVVGGPTHVHGMSREVTRKEAHPADPDGLAVHEGVREWLAALPAVDGLPAAAFDTRVDKARLISGAASHGIGRALRARGYRLVAPPESFQVSGTEGPLLDGELARARAFGALLAERLSASSSLAR